MNLPPFLERETEHTLILELDPRPSPVIRVGGGLGVVAAVVFGVGFGVKHLVVAQPPDPLTGWAGVAVCAAVALLGLLMLGTTASFAVAGGRLWVRDSWGPLHLIRDRRLNDIVTIEVRFDEVEVNGRTLEGPDRLGALRIETSTGRPMLGAVAYPAWILLPLAERLSRACEERAPALEPIELIESGPRGSGRRRFSTRRAG